MSCCPPSDVTTSVKEYYGKVLQTSDDLLTTACQTPATSMPKYVRETLAQVHDEVVSKYYGCGIVVPQYLTGMNIVDLGSGSGRDCYALSKLVGENGNVIGVDMTDEQLEVANKYIDYHRDKFNFKKSNVKFVKGVIEDLQQAGIADSTIDIVISNCVINLCKDKQKVLQEVYRVLKYGGELYFSDVYCDKQLDESIRNHEVLWNECVSGALWWKELNKMAIDTGFEIPRIYSAHSFDITKPELKKVVGDARFVSVTYRLFKLDQSKKETENKQVIYKGGVSGSEDSLKFDYKMEFATNKTVNIDHETWNLINQSRFSKLFQSNKAPCCVKVEKTQIENPFEIAEQGDFKTATSGGGGCC